MKSANTKRIHVRKVRKHYGYILRFESLTSVSIGEAACKNFIGIDKNPEQGSPEFNCFMASSIQTYGDIIRGMFFNNKEHLLCNAGDFAGRLSISNAKGNTNISKEHIVDRLQEACPILKEIDNVTGAFQIYAETHDADIRKGIVLTFNRSKGTVSKSFWGYRWFYNAFRFCKDHSTVLAIIVAIVAIIFNK